MSWKAMGAMCVWSCCVLNLGFLAQRGFETSWPAEIPFTGLVILNLNLIVGLLIYRGER